MICDFCLRLVAGLQNMKHLTFLNLSANSIQVSVFLMMLLMITEMYRLLPTDIVVCLIFFMPWPFNGVGECIMLCF